MKIDKYITKLKMERKELKEKYNDMQFSTDKNLKTGVDPLFKEKVDTRTKFVQTTDKLIFLKKLRKELINNEMQDQENKQR